MDANIIKVLASYFAQSGSPGMPVEGARPMLGGMPESMSPFVPHELPQPESWGGGTVPTLMPPVAGGISAPQPDQAQMSNSLLPLLMGQAARQGGPMSSALERPKPPYHPGVGNFTTAQPSVINMMPKGGQPALATLMQALSGLRR